MVGMTSSVLGMDPCIPSLQNRHRGTEIGLRMPLDIIVRVVSIHSSVQTINPSDPILQIWTASTEIDMRLSLNVIGVLYCSGRPVIHCPRY